MARLFSSTSNSLATASPVSTATTTLTMAGWFYWNASSGTTIAEILYNGTPAANGYGLLINNGAGSAGTAVTLLLGGVSISAAGAFTLSYQTWTHIAITRSGTTWTLYKNGVSQGTGTSGPGAPTGSTIINPSGGTTPNYAVAEAAFWSAALTAQELLSLAAGVQTRRVRPGSLVGYWPLFGLSSPEPDLSGNAINMSLTGTPAQFNHAPMTLFTRQKPTLAYPPSLFPPSGGVAAIARPAILSGGRL